jgi:hypothetical protein
MPVGERERLFSAARIACFAWTCLRRAHIRCWMFTNAGARTSCVRAVRPSFADSSSHTGNSEPFSVAR